MSNLFLKWLLKKEKKIKYPGCFRAKKYLSMQLASKVLIWTRLSGFPWPGPRKRRRTRWKPRSDMAGSMLGGTSLLQGYRELNSGIRSQVKKHTQKQGNRILLQQRVPVPVRSVQCTGHAFIPWPRIHLRRHPWSSPHPGQQLPAPSPKHQQRNNLVLKYSYRISRTNFS